MLPLKFVLSTKLSSYVTSVIVCDLKCAWVEAVVTIFTAATDERSRSSTTKKGSSRCFTTTFSILYVTETINYQQALNGMEN